MENENNAFNSEGMYSYHKEDLNADTNYYANNNQNNGYPNAGMNNGGYQNAGTNNGGYQQTNTYQYQDSYQYQNNAGAVPPVKKKKKGIRPWQWILAAAIFVVVAIGGYFAITKILPGTLGSSSKLSAGTANNDGGVIGNVETVTPGAVTGSTDVSGVVSSVMPSVVSITQTSKQSGYSVFGQYYEGDATGSGSGFIVSQKDKELLVVTNNHVVDGADKITVTFIDGTTAEATVKGTDETADLAVISVDLSKVKASTQKAIKVAKLGAKDDLKVGQMVIAIGNALGYGQSVTVGYLSAKDREVSVTNSTTNTSNKMVLLQTDAAINPGNSGGPLLDMNGNVIGINSVKYASSEVEGMCFAIPMSSAVSIINELMDREVLTDDEKGYLGITGRNISDQISKAYGLPVGIYVVQVGKSGSAYDGGVKEGDVITKINDKAVTTIEQVQETVTSYRIGTEISITVERSDNGTYKEETLKLTLKGKSTLDDLDVGDSSTSGSDGSSSDSSGSSGSQFGNVY